MTVKFKNKSGQILEVNESSVPAAIAAGWVPEDAKPIELDARGVPFDAEIHVEDKYKNGNWKYVKGMTAKKAAKHEAKLVHALEG